jgi:molecular chaperone GrpE
VSEHSGAEGFSFSDKRRIDPETFQVRESPTETPASRPVQDDSIIDGELVDDVSVEAADLDVRDAQIAELTADLQRLHAEYANYRKRVERDRELVREQAIANALAELLPVLDDVERARQHGDLEGAFRSVGEALESTVSRLGMTQFGEPGDAFDPLVHQAIASEPSAAVDAPTASAIHQRGYTYAGRVIRPAVVSVSEPA